MVGSISRIMPSHICLGSVTAEVPEIKIAMITSSKEVMKARIAPQTNRGSDCRQGDAEKRLDSIGAQSHGGPFER